jgi:hypothetical protein
LLLWGDGISPLTGQAGQLQNRRTGRESSIQEGEEEGSDIGAEVARVWGERQGRRQREAGRKERGGGGRREGQTSQQHLLD